MLVDLVSVTTRDGLRLDGIWRKPSQVNSSQLGVDVVVLHHGVGGNFYGPGMFEEFSDALLNKGCAVLRVNNRGHDPISRATVGGEMKRLGAAYEAMDESGYDWEAWVDFAETAGYRSIGLWGHSLGATKSIYHMGTQGDPRVKCVVAGSPPRFSYSAFAGLEEGEEFKRIFLQAQKYIGDGQPQALIETPYPTPLLITAEVFVEKYGPDEKYDILKYIPSLQAPLLSFTFESIPGADHAYTHQREYVWGVVSQWLENV